MKRTIPGLNFSVDDLMFGVQYIGKTTTNTYAFFDSKSGSVFKWNEDSRMLRRNSSHTFDGRNAKCTSKTIGKEDLLENLNKYITTYRKTVKRNSTR